MTGETLGESAQVPLVVACGALVSELRAVFAANAMSDAIEVRYLPAPLHNRPEGIVPAIRDVLAAAGAADPMCTRPVMLGYADCGTGGGIDALIAELPHLRRLPGAHCYEFFAGSAVFASLHEAELGTFYLTDFLAKHFDALVWQGLGLDRHPQLRELYFGNYTRVVLLSQTDDAEVVVAGRAAAERLGLRFEHVPTHLDPFADAVSVALAPRLHSPALTASDSSGKAA